jgi:dTDP-L-rhamnose 4-epimerase
MRKQILVTGGAGFIGSHLCTELLEQGCGVRVLDNLSEQVHGPEKKWPKYLDPQVEMQLGDIRNPDQVRKALQNVDAVFHLVAAVGVGQSMYQIREYTSVNNLGTAVLLEALIEKKVDRLIVASSMSIYGEGLYKAADGTTRTPADRCVNQLRAGDWHVRDAAGEELSPIPTPETKPPSLASIYALNKYDQERMCLMIGRAYDIPTVAMRFFNVYGPNQALSNPYTGVLAIFAASLLNDKSPVIFEDGFQQRDFVSVYDVARACRLALETPKAAGKAFNVGSGRRYTIRAVAQRMAEALGRERIRPEITGKYRVGDIRHCFADTTLAREVLGYKAQVSLEEGLLDLAGWLEKQASHQQEAPDARAELAMRGLMVG